MDLINLKVEKVQLKVENFVLFPNETGLLKMETTTTIYQEASFICFY